MREVLVLSVVVGLLAIRAFMLSRRTGPGYAWMLTYKLVFSWSKYSGVWAERTGSWSRVLDLLRILTWDLANEELAVNGRPNSNLEERSTDAQGNLMSPDDEQLKRPGGEGTKQ